MLKINLITSLIHQLSVPFHLSCILITIIFSLFTPIPYHHLCWLHPRQPLQPFKRQLHTLSFVSTPLLNSFRANPLMESEASKLFPTELIEYSRAFACFQTPVLLLIPVAVSFFADFSVMNTLTSKWLSIFFLQWNIPYFIDNRYASVLLEVEDFFFVVTNGSILWYASFSL